MSIRASKSVFASCAHRYWNPKWPFAKNLQVYGADCSEEGIGSNFKIEIATVGEPSLNEGCLVKPLQALKEMVDHQCLFAPGSYFVEKPSTLENISLWLANTAFADPFVESITVWESDQLGCRVLRGGEVELCVRFQNLHLNLFGRCDETTGLLAVRSQVLETLREFAITPIHESNLHKWSVELFAQLQARLRLVRSFRVDLGRHEYVSIQSQS